MAVPNRLPVHRRLTHRRPYVCFNRRLLVVRLSGHIVSAHVKSRPNLPTRTTATTTIMDAIHTDNTTNRAIRQLNNIIAPAGAELVPPLPHPTYTTSNFASFYFVFLQIMSYLSIRKLYRLFFRFSSNTFGGFVESSRRRRPFPIWLRRFVGPSRAVSLKSQSPPTLQHLHIQLNLTLKESRQSAGFASVARPHYPVCRIFLDLGEDAHTHNKNWLGNY